MLDHRVFLVKEQVRLLKMTDRYDIFDPETGEQLGYAQEKPGSLIVALRLLGLNKQMMPTAVEIRENESTSPVIVIRRGFTFFRSKVSVFDGEGELIGYFKSKIMSMGGGFLIYDARDQQIGDVKGDWKGWNFKFLTSQGAEIGTVTKKWGGALKEIFTSADSYVIQITDGIPTNGKVLSLLLAAGLAIDIVYKER